MVNGNLYLAITLVVLQCYYLSEKRKTAVSLCPTCVFLSSNTKQGWIYSLKRNVSCLFLFLRLPSQFRIKSGNSGFSPSQVHRKTNQGNPGKVVRCRMPKPTGTCISFLIVYARIQTYNVCNRFSSWLMWRNIEIFLACSLLKNIAMHLKSMQAPGKTCCPSL